MIKHKMRQDNCDLSNSPFYQTDSLINNRLKPKDYRYFTKKENLREKPKL